VTVVVDASVALKWALQEEHTEEALALWDRWQQDLEWVIAPPLFRSEVTNVLYRRSRRGELSFADAAEILDAILSIVAIVEPASLYHSALDLAGALDVGSTYDAMYLALAESQDGVMWTADRRFVRAAEQQSRHVRYIAERP